MIPLNFSNFLLKLLISKLIHCMYEHNPNPKLTVGGTRHTRGNFCPL